MTRVAVFLESFTRLSRGRVQRRMSLESSGEAYHPVALMKR